MDNFWTEYRKDLTYEYLVPHSWWTQDTLAHLLMVQVPGFKNDEVKIGADESGHVIVSGERKVDEHKVIRFEQSLRVPGNCDIHEASGIVEKDIFIITIPKKVTQEKEDFDVQDPTSTKGDDQNKLYNALAKNKDGDAFGDNQDEVRLSREEQKEACERNILKKLTNKVMKNKSIILTASIAFSVGLLVSHRHNKKGEKAKDSQ